MGGGIRVCENTGGGGGGGGDKGQTCKKFINLNIFKEGRNVHSVPPPAPFPSKKKHHMITNIPVQTKFKLNAITPQPQGITLTLSVDTRLIMFGQKGREQE